MPLLLSQKDYYEAIDLSNNDIQSLQSYSVLVRLKTLIVNRNKVSKVENISSFFPKLESLSLISNKIADFEQIAQLTHFKSLQRLFLINNPIAERKNYRELIAAKFPKLKVLDFQKITAVERNNGLRLFPATKESVNDVRAMTKKEKVKLLIEAAKTVEELTQLELILKLGDVNESLLDQRIRELGLAV